MPTMEFSGFSDGIQLVDAVLGLLIASIAGYAFVARKIIRNKDRNLLVLVSTGGTCRDPMAKAILMHLLKEDSSKIEIVSAGTASQGDRPATPMAIRVANRRLGKDYLFSHKSSFLDQSLIDSAKLILTMGVDNKSTIIKNFVNADQKTFTIREFLGETGTIVDPYSSSDVSSPDAERRYEKTFDDLFGLLSKNGSALNIFRSVVR